MSFYVTVTPTIQNVEVEVNPQTLPFEVVVNVNNGGLDLTTTGESGPATYDSSTGELNIPNYSLSGLGGVPLGRTLTINGTTYDLSANRTWSVGDLLSTGSYSNPSWITDLAWSKITGTPTSLSGYGILDPVVLTSQTYSNPSWITSLGWSKITSTPTTLSGYGITDAYTSGQVDTLLSAKQNTLSLTTTGNSGASTLVGSTLNVPTYTLSGLGGVPTSRQLTINGIAFDLSADRSWTIPTHDAVTIGIGNGLSLSGQILSLALASGSTNGALSSTDWNTFNNKQNALTNPVTGTGTANELTYFTGASTIASLSTATYPSLTELSYVKGVTSAIQTQLNARVTGTGTSGQVAFWNGTSSQTGSNNLFFDSANGRLGIGTNDLSNIIRLRIVGDTSNENLWMDRFDSNPTFIFRRANGSISSPSAIIQDNIIGFIGARGYNGSNFTSNSLTSIVSVASENWTTTANGAFLNFNTTANGATISSNNLRIWQNGNVTIQNGGTFTNAGFRLDVNGTARVQGDLTIADTRNIILSTTTGTRIGTATNQRLALWNATPNVQPTNAITAAAFVANTSGIVNDTATFGGYTIGQIVAALQRIGALA